MERQKTLRRTFSMSFKKEKVELIELGKISVRELCRVYEVSETAVYKWLRKYSKYSRTERVVVEKISEGRKNIELVEKIRDLERALGRKQLEVDYYKGVLAEISEEKGEDLEKKYKPKR